MHRRSRGGGGRVRKNRRETEGREDSQSTRQLMEHIQGEGGSEVSSLADVSSSTLCNVKLSTESTVMKRLFKEYLAVRKLPVLNVSVAPLLNNFMEWHGNLLGPEGTCYEGGVFHFSIAFETDHPRHPPKVTMLSRIEHPCVHQGSVSLDFLTEQEKGGKGNRVAAGATNRYKFWSPGYTVMSILVQLQAFLFEGTAEIALESLQDVTEYTEKRKKWESGVQFSVEQSLRYSCTSCKHRPRKYWPPLSTEPAGPPIAAEEHLFEENATCFFTLKTHSEAPLGLGVSFQKDVRTGRIQSVRCVPDVISLNAFKGHNVKEAWGQAFSHWMPLFLQKSGAERSLHLAQRSLSTIYAGNPNEFQPFMALDLYPRLMSHLAVSFAQSDEGGDAIRSLRAYSYLHRLFLEFLQKNPSLVTSAKEIVQGFVDDPTKRTMEACNAIGLLVIYIGFTGHTWAELAPAYLAEAFDRNAQRVIKKYPELDTTEPNPKIDSTRVSKTFTASSGSGWKFLMVQLLFNRTFVAPRGSSIPFLCNQYDKCWSLLPSTTEDALLKEKKTIVAVNSFSSLYENIEVPYPGEEKMVDILRQSVINSRKKRYHGDKGIEVLSPEEFEKQRLGSIKPLEELVVTGGSLHDDEKEWKTLCENRFGLTELPSFYTSISQPWKKLYVQYNLQELVSKLNDNPDFKLFYHTLELSKGVVTRFELVTFLPDNIKSQYFFLSRILEQLPHLTHLVITKGEASLGHKGFRELVKGMAKGSGSLQVLDMRYLDISEAHVSKLAESHLTSEGLTCLNLEGNSLESEGSTKLAQLMVKHRSLPNLSELNLKACKITDEGMKALAEGLLVKRNIRRLNLSKNPAGATGLARVLEVLAYSPCIEELILTDFSGYVSSTSHLQTSLGKLFQLTVTLKTLNFWKTPIADAFSVANMKQLAENETITTLGLGSTNFSSSTLNNFATVLCSKKSKLQQLEFDNNALSLTGCADINEQAKGWSSSVTKLSLASSSSIFSMTDLSNTKTFGNMVTFFTKTLGNLTVLDVSRCNLSSSAAELFGNVLSKNPLLKELNFAFNNIGKHGARFIAAGLASNSTLEVLRLDKNSLGAAGAHYLASLLEKPTCLLKELHLFCNYIDVPGTVAICKALQTNKHLCVLDLGLNRARKRGATAVCEMLAVNTTLTTLSLKFNYIPDPLAIKIVKQIAEAPHCKVSTVKLAGNSLQYDTLVTIVTMLKTCVRAVTFDLAARGDYKAPERMERTVYLSPLAANVTPDMVKKLFYSKKCGAIRSVKIDVHKKKKAAFAKANYALVEFAHKDSVELAIDLVKKKEAHIGTNQPMITRAGLSTKTAAEAAGRAVGELV